MENLIPPLNSLIEVQKKIYSLTLESVEETFQIVISGLDLNNHYIQQFLSTQINLALKIRYIPKEKDVIISLMNNINRYYKDHQLSFEITEKPHFRKFNDFFDPNLEYNSEIIKAIQKDDIESLHILLFSPNFEFDIRYCSTFLAYSSIFNSIKCFKFLFLSGVDPNAIQDSSKKSQLFYSPIQAAIISGNIEMIKLLEQKNANYFGALKYAVLYQRNNIVRYIIETKKELLETDEEYRIFFEACAQVDNIEALEILEHNQIIIPIKYLRLLLKLSAFLNSFDLLLYLIKYLSNNYPQKNFNNSDFKILSIVKIVIENDSIEFGKIFFPLISIEQEQLINFYYFAIDNEKMQIIMLLSFIHGGMYNNICILNHLAGHKNSEKNPTFRLNAMKYLVENGINPNINLMFKEKEKKNDKYSYTPFYESLSHNHLDTASYLFPLTQDFSQCLHLALTFQDLSDFNNPSENDFVSKLIPLCDINEKNHFNHTPLQIAIMKNRINALNYLINQSSINVEDNIDGQSILFYTIRERSYQIFHILIQSGKFTQQYNNIDSEGMNLLCLAARSGDINLLKEISENISTEFNINFQDKFGWTALHHAVISKSLPIVQYLVEHYNNIEIHKKNNANNTPKDLGLPHQKDGCLPILDYLDSLSD